MSRQIVAYYTLSLIVAVFGIWLCFFSYKKKTVAEKKKIQLPVPSFFLFPTKVSIEKLKNIYIATLMTHIYKLTMIYWKCKSICHWIVKALTLVQIAQG